MRNVKQIWFICVILAVFFGRSAQARLMDLAHFKLDNGLEVAVIENHRAPVVLSLLIYKTGAVNDPKGKGGIAHLLEHLMFRGTKRLPGQMFNDITEELGAEDNAYTSHYVTGYYEFCDVSKLEVMLAMEAERMQNLIINDDDFVKERDIVLQERRQRYETNPSMLFYEMMTKTLWQNHPLANSVSGSVEEIKALTADDARAFYNIYYRPDNALLILSGDINVDEAKEVAQRYFGHIKAKGKVAQIEYAPAETFDVDMVVKLKGITRPRFTYEIRLEPQGFDKTDELVLSFIEAYLSADDTSYLPQKLVYDKKKLLGIDVSVSFDKKTGGTFSFYAVPADEAMAPDEIKTLIKQTTVEAMNALNEEELQKIKNRYLSNMIYLQEDAAGAAQFAGSMLLSDYTADEIINFDKAVKAVSVEDMLKAWEKVLTQKAKVGGYLTEEAD